MFMVCVPGLGVLFLCFFRHFVVVSVLNCAFLLLLFFVPFLLFLLVLCSVVSYVLFSGPSSYPLYIFFVLFACPFVQLSVVFYLHINLSICSSVSYVLFAYLFTCVLCFEFIHIAYLSLICLFNCYFVHIV